MASRFGTCTDCHKRAVIRNGLIAPHNKTTGRGRCTGGDHPPVVGTSSYSVVDPCEFSVVIASV